VNLAEGDAPHVDRDVPRTGLGDAPPVSFDAVRQALTLIAFVLVTFAAAGVGGLLTAGGVRDWYPSLHKPAWTPPAWLFGPAWTALYLCIAVAGFLAWRRVGFRAARGTWVLFNAQLVLNAAWSGLFFQLRQPGWAFAEILLLWAAILATAAALFRISAIAGALVVPYLSWVAFAAALNFAIWRLNS
jgi:tryptophan-rich sensory protein